ncbi:MAG TPA: hypothetical protein VFA41_07670 [Ktedonobacteraceae bacterium]|jgi:pimeloyl-ACP methyl ester carboxylesterase|nr:hypothetical protein [Ktedonobacteraceae bacterium]
MSNEELTKTSSANSSEQEESLPAQKGDISLQKERLRWRNILARVVLFLIFAAGFFFSVIPVGRAATRALLLLPSVLLASQPGVVTMTEEPVRHVKKTITSSNGPVYLDVYEPAVAAPPIPGGREGMVVISGVGDNRKEPQLVNFLQALAHTGVVVMLVTTPTLIQYDLSAADSDGVVQAFQTLERWPGVGANRVGIVAFSAGDVLACFGAADARIRAKVAFLTLFGGYFNAKTLIRAAARRALTVDGKTQPWNPQYVPIQVLANVIEPLLPPTEGPRMVNALSPAGMPLTPDELASFSHDTVTVYHLLRGDEPDMVDSNLASLSQPLQALLDTMSPSRVIGQIDAPVYLMHDRSDQFVPFTESRDFAAALARIHHRYDFAEFGIFQHVEVKSGLNFWQLVGDGTTLFRLVDETMLPGS